MLKEIWLWYFCHGSSHHGWKNPCAAVGGKLAHDAMTRRASSHEPYDGKECSMIERGLVDIVYSLLVWGVCSTSPLVSSSYNNLGGRKNAKSAQSGISVISGCNAQQNLWPFRTSKSRTISFSLEHPLDAFMPLLECCLTPWRKWGLAGRLLSITWPGHKKARAERPERNFFIPSRAAALVHSHDDCCWLQMMNGLLKVCALQFQSINFFDPVNHTVMIPYYWSCPSYIMRTNS